MSRSEEFFHGTTEHLRPGDVVLPGERTGKATFPHDTDPRYAYATPDESTAWNYAEKAWHASSWGIPRVYRVTPKGAHEKDPEVDSAGRRRGNFSDDRRSSEGWRIEEEIPMPEHMGDPEDWK